MPVRPFMAPVLALIHNPVANPSKTCRSRPQGRLARIEDPDQREPVRRGRRPCEAPVARVQHRAEPVGLAGAATDGDRAADEVPRHMMEKAVGRNEHGDPVPDRKSTRLNSSHGYISYAVFCLKKKKKTTNQKAKRSSKRSTSARVAVARVL